MVQVVILNVFCGPKEYPASQFGVKRRAALEEAAEVYTHRQLQVLFPSSKNVPHLMVIYPEEHITAAAADLVGLCCSPLALCISQVRQIYLGLHSCHPRICGAEPRWSELAGPLLSCSKHDRLFYPCPTKNPCSASCCSAGNATPRCIPSSRPLTRAREGSWMPTADALCCRTMARSWTL